MNELVTWFDLAQKIGSGASFVLGISLYFIWRAYTTEVKYSKDRDVQTLTVLMNLTKIVENLESRDRDFSQRYDVTMGQVLNAIQSLKELIINHYPR